MKNIIRSLMGLVIYALVVVGFTACNETEKESFEAGFAAVDITPLDGTVYDPLMAKALVIRQGTEMGAIVVCDVIGIENGIVEKVRSIVTEKSDIPAEHISISATHTHSGRVSADISEGIAQSIFKALENLQPIEVSSGTAVQEGLAFNRRFLMVDGTVRMNPALDPVTNSSFENGYPYLNHEIIRPVAPVDTDLPIIMFTSPEDNQPIGSLTCFAMHTCVFGPGYSADFPGFLARDLSEEFGESFISIFGEGACGDINHWDVNKPGDWQNGPERSEEIGKELASTIKDAVGSLSPGTLDLQIISQIVNVPLNPVTQMDIEWAKSAKADGFKDFGSTAFNNRGFLAGVRARKILHLANLQEQNINSLPLEVIVYRIDDQTAVVTLPGEIFIELALNIKEQSPFENTLIIELANNDCGYIPTLKAYSEGGYEVVYSIVAPGSGEMLAEAAIEALTQLGS